MNAENPVGKNTEKDEDDGFPLCCEGMTFGQYSVLALMLIAFLTIMYIVQNYSTDSFFLKALSVAALFLSFALFSFFAAMYCRRIKRIHRLKNSKKK